MRMKNVRLIVVGFLTLSLPNPVAWAATETTTAVATPEANFESAEESFAREDLKEAARFLRLAADQNHMPAQVRIGEMINAAEDHEEAFGWFLTAAFQGDAAGQYNTGQMYGLGTGVDQSPEKALFWTKKAANQDYLPAVKILSNAYSSDPNAKDGVGPAQKFFGVVPDKEQADFWSAKLPDLEAAEAKRGRKLAAERAKARAEKAKKAQEEKSKLECGLKC